MSLHTPLLPAAGRLRLSKDASLLCVSVLAGALLAAGPGLPPEAGRVERLVQQLGSERFGEREAASRELERTGEGARKALQKAARSPDLELRLRATRLLKTFANRVRAREAAALQGRWVLKTTEYLGEKADQDPAGDKLRKLVAYRWSMPEKRELEEDLTRYRTTLEFRGNAYEYRQWVSRSACFGGSGVVSTKGHYYLDVERNPKVLQAWRTEGPADPGETKTVYCIYSVSGDTLHLGINLNNDPKNLPARFATDKDEDVALLTFKREKG